MMPVIDLFGGTIVTGYDPDDKPGPQGFSFNQLKKNQIQNALSNFGDVNHDNISSRRTTV
jgi:hypothetical protein